jgi:pSer/pThr/pTyr-binding forkhead associated (FHA) protein
VKATEPERDDRAEANTVQLHRAVVMEAPPTGTSPTLSKVAPIPMAAAAYVLRFLSGPRAGAEVALKARAEYVFGRGKEADLVLGEDLVSRRHAILTLAGEHPAIADLGSTNGTFVNGERVHGRAPLRSGDRLLIGTSIARLVEVDDDEATTVGEKGVTDRRSPHQGSTMAGRLDEVPLVDLLQLFSNSRKSGTLVTRGADGLDGHVLLSAGQIAGAFIEGKPELMHRKALARLLRLISGAFEFLPLATGVEPPAVPTELQEPTELLLMDALRLTDELSVVEPELPKAHASLVVAKPLPGRLRALEPTAIDLFQLVLEQGTFGAVIDHSPLDDVEAVRGVLRLISLGYVKVKV